MERYVKQKIETTMDGEMCAPQCYFYSANRRMPICWLGRGYERIRNGCRTALCKYMEMEADTNEGSKQQDR